MSGLLDLMGGSYGEDDPRRAAAIALFAGLLGGKGNLGGIVSDSITGAQKSFLLNREAQQRSQENQSQLEERRRKVADEEARRTRIQQAITAFPQAKPVAGPPTEDGVQPMRNPTRNDILPWALGVMPDSRELANLGFGQIERLENREDAQTAKRESQAAQLKAMLEKAAADRDAAGERKRLEIQGREDLARLGASLRPDRAEPAPSTEKVSDPNDATKALLIDTRTYRGGGIGSPGVIGYAPANAQSGAIGKKEQMAADAKEQLAGLIDDLRASYDTLNASGDIASTKKDVPDNAAAWLKSSTLGQVAGKIAGSKAQSERNKIMSTRPALINAIKSATGMSAQQMNSNVELKLMLDSATDPTLDIEANRAALDRIERDYIGGTGKAATSKTNLTPAEQDELKKLRERFKR